MFFLNCPLIVVQFVMDFETDPDAQKKVNSRSAQWATPKKQQYELFKDAITPNIRRKF